jgi:lysostaphin
MQKYLAEKEVLKTFHESAPLAEDQLLAVLHHAGIGSQNSSSPPKTPTKPANGKPPASAPVKPPAKPVAPPGEGEAASKSPTGNKLPPVPERYAGAYRWPLDAGIVSSEYGERWGKLHKGIDIAADQGEPVYAMADGVVIYASDGMRGYGNVVIVRHDANLSTLYAHNSALEVHAGDRVKQGELIALLGSTGHSTGPHTHFEIRNGDQPVDPRAVLPKSSRF